MPTPVPPIPVVLCLGTAGCHLCELAEEMILAVFAANPGLDGRVAVECVDIIESSALVDRFGIRIPVLLAPRAAPAPCAHQGNQDPGRHSRFLAPLEVPADGVGASRSDQHPWQEAPQGDELAWPFTPEELVVFLDHCILTAEAIDSSSVATPVPPH